MMNTAEQKILDGYFSLLEQLTPTMKLRLIERLKASTKTPKAESVMNTAFGAWGSGDSAEELIDKIRSSRSTNRRIEKL